MLAQAVVLLALLSIHDFAEAAKCPTITTQKDFDVTKYAGLWYEIRRSSGVVFEIGSKCVNATYTLNADGTVGVWNQAINLFGKYSTIRGTASAKNSVEPGALEVVFEKPGQKGDYNVIRTDYNNYSLVYSCKDIPVIGKWEFIWILARTKTLPATIVEDLQKTLTDMGANAASLKDTEQDC